MKKRNRRWPYFVLTGIAVIVAAAAGWWFAASRPATMAANVSAPAIQNTSVGNRVVQLYFSDDQARFLKAEQRVIQNATDEVAYCRILIEELIRGSRKGKGRTLPENAAVRACYITDAGTAYIDFEETAFDNHPGGIGTELLSVYAIVNTLILNSDLVTAVQLLIGGREAPTLAGHVDISRPFTANMLLVR